MNKSCVLIIQNDKPEELELYETYLREHTNLTLIHAYEMNETDLFSSVEEFDAFITSPYPSQPSVL